MARDGAASFGLTAPPESVAQPGVHLTWQETLGRRVILAGGLSISEPRDASRELGARVRLALPFDAGLSQQWYPWVGIEQPLVDGLPRYQFHIGIGVERHWIPEAAGFLELRYQRELDSQYHLHLGLRFWPGRLQRLDARLRDSAPVRPRAEEAFDNRIELTIPGQTVATIRQPDVEPQSPPRAFKPPQSTPVKPPQSPGALSSPTVTPPRVTQPTAAQLEPGYYLHLGLFRSRESIKRYRQQAAAQPWGDELRTLEDSQAGGTRILLGPYTETEARRRQQALSEQNIDSFVYRWPR